MNYVAEALQTKSTSFHGEKVSIHDFHNSMQAAIIALENLDKIKKALFYGKGPDCTEEVATCINLPCEVLSKDENTNVGIDVLHAIIGKATEAGELLEAVITGFFGDDGFDYFNVVEEVGDGFWYDAILANALGFTFEEAQKVNIEKLRKRYPNKFTEYDAQVRDLRAERNVLEGRAPNDHGFTGGFWAAISEDVAAVKRAEGISPFIVDDDECFIRKTAVVCAGLGLGIEAATSTADLCDKAPEGWVCTRADGHEGPCAGIPVADK